MSEADKNHIAALAGIESLGKIMSVTRFVTAPSDINKIKETHSDDELNRLLEAVRIAQPELCWVVEKGGKKNTTQSELF